MVYKFLNTVENSTNFSFLMEKHFDEIFDVNLKYENVKEENLHFGELKLTLINFHLL